MVPQKRQSNPRGRKREGSPTVKDFRDILAAARQLMTVRVPRDDNLVEAIREVETVLNMYSSQPASEIVVAIRRHFEAVTSQIVQSEQRPVEAISPSTPLETVRQWMAEPDINRERLTAIARLRFGVPPGRLAKLSMSGIREEVEAAIHSIEGFDIISRVASNDNRQS